MSDAIGSTQGDDNFYLELQRMSVEFSSGGAPPAPERVKEVARKMDDSFNKYNDMIARLSLSRDYQALEYYSITVSNLKREDVTLSDIQESVRWQIESMNAYSENRQPPIPSPKTIEMMEKKKGGGMGSPLALVTSPFTGRESCFDDPQLRETILKLQNDHESLIRMGAGYGSFDPLGQLAYIDQIETIEERWALLMTKLDLGSHISREFKDQTSAFLSGMGLTVREFFELLEESKNWMRKRAEDQRDRKSVV